MPWLAENVGFTDRTAQQYMRVARNTKCASDLPSVRAALAVLAEPKPEPERDPGKAERIAFLHAQARRLIQVTGFCPRPPASDQRERYAELQREPSEWSFRQASSEVQSIADRVALIPGCEEEGAAIEAVAATLDRKRRAAG